MAKYNKIKLAINNNNYRLMANYKTIKVAISQHKYIVMAIYKHSKVATTQQKGIDMATYKQAFKPNEIDRKRSQDFYPSESRITDYPFIFSELTMCIKIFNISMPLFQK